MAYPTSRNQRDPLPPVVRGRPKASFGGWLPLVLASAVLIAVAAWMYPRTTIDRTENKTNTAPSVQTVTPAPSPMTEPRPTQAPQP